MIKVNGGRCEASGKPMELMTEVVVAFGMLVMALAHEKKDISRETIIFGITNAAIEALNDKGEKIDRAKIGLALIAKAGEAGQV